MKKLAVIIVVIMGISPWLGAQPAAAFPGFHKKSEPKDLFPRAVNHHLYPTMVVRGGLLAKDFAGRWTLSGLPLVLVPQGKETTRVLPRGMVEGRQAYVLGPLLHGVLRVHYISVLSPDQAIKRGTFYERQISGLPQLAPATLPR